MSTVASQPGLITREGWERLTAELERLTTIQRQRVADDLRDARDDGSEPGDNAGLAGLLDDQAALERRIEELRTTLSLVTVADPPALGVAGIGQRVRIRIGGGGPRDCQLVGAVEADPATGGISIASPIGQALIGKRAGETVEVLTPGGIRVVELISVG
jgi:transcription elongation factor GreA